ncbi:putative propanediol utilization protein PduM, partial [Salmonella enterica subsp. enterica serovar Enteritidis str. 22704]
SVSTRRCASCSSTCRCWVSLRMQKPTIPPPGNSRRAGVWHPRTAQPAQPAAAGYPGKKLARLPLVFTDERGLPLVLHAGSVLSYRDVALLSRGRVVVHRKCIVTALAREAANARNIQLIKQE